MRARDAMRDARATRVSVPAPRQSSLVVSAVARA